MKQVILKRATQAVLLDYRQPFRGFTTNSRLSARRQRRITQNGARVELAALQLFQRQYEGTKYKPTAKYIFLSPTAEMIGVRIYLRATDMDHILQTQVQRGIRREIDIDKIREVLHLKGECCVSNCANRHTSLLTLRRSWLTQRTVNLFIHTTAASSMVMMSMIWRIPKIIYELSVQMPVCNIRTPFSTRFVID
jgi:hypothetical protein